MRRTAGIALCILGLIVALGGIAFGVFGQSDNQATAVAKGGSAPYIYTAPGVLDAVDSDVVVKATGSKNADVTVAFGYSDDVASWAEGLKATRITGLEDWKNLKTVNADGKTDDVQPLANSDMWLETKTAKGTVEFDRPYKGTSLSLIATSSDGKAPEISLTWQRDNSSFNVFPVILAGVLLAIIGAALIVLEMQDKRQRAERLAIRERKEARRAARASAETTVLSTHDTDLTGSARNVQTVATGSALGAGILMSSPNSEELRERSLSSQDRLVLPGQDGGDAPAGEGYGEPGDGYGEPGDGAAYGYDSGGYGSAGYSGEAGYGGGQAGYDSASGYGGDSYEYGGNQAGYGGGQAGYGGGPGYSGGSAGYSGPGAGYDATGYDSAPYGSAGYGADSYGFGGDSGSSTQIFQIDDDAEGYRPVSSGQPSDGFGQPSAGGGVDGYSSPAGYDGAGYQVDEQAQGYPSETSWAPQDSWAPQSSWGAGAEDARTQGEDARGGWAAGASDSGILAGTPGRGDGATPIFDASESLGRHPNEAAAWEAAFGSASTSSDAGADDAADAEAAETETAAGAEAGAQESYLGPNNAWRARWSFVQGDDGYTPRDHQATEEN